MEKKIDALAIHMEHMASAINKMEKVLEDNSKRDTEVKLVVQEVQHLREDILALQGKSWQILLAFLTGAVGIIITFLKG